MREIAVRRLTKTYPHAGGRLTVLNDLSFRASPEEITVLIGESGCGKTTLLRVVGGLEAPDAGRVEGFDAKRSAFVFQEPRLLPWRDAIGNLRFGMRGAKDGRARAQALLRLMGLENFARSRPEALSGGMAQRVALARALAAEPEYLLMDEPFAALDPLTRASMQRLALGVHREKRVGMLFVTHSVDEALLLADTVLLMADGGIQSAYRLNDFPFPRDLSESGLSALKKKILDDLERKMAS